MVPCSHSCHKNRKPPGNEEQALWRDHLSLCNFLTTCQAQDCTCSLPPRHGHTAEGVMAGEGLSTPSQTGWSDAKTEIWEAHVCMGSSARLRLLLGVKARDRRCHMWECWMEGFKTWKCWWGLGFYSIEFLVVVTQLHLYPSQVSC